MPAPVRRARFATLLLVGLVGLAQVATASARISGNVWRVDQEAGLVTIIDAGKRITFSYGADTVIRRGSTDRAIGDLRRGDRVVVTLAEETPDALRARLIAIAGPPLGQRGLDSLR